MREIEMLFIKDLIHILREKNQDSKNKSQNDLVEMGKHFAYYDVLSVIHLQLMSYNIDLAIVGLENFNPEAHDL